MQIDKKQNGDISICNINGDIDLDSSPVMRRMCNEMADKEVKKIVINLSGVAYIDSSGLATLVEMLKRIKGYGGAVRLCSLNDKVRGLFEITKLDRIFNIFDTEEEAAKDFT